jgi:hypothetical protein
MTLDPTFALSCVCCFWIVFTIVNELLQNCPSTGRNLYCVTPAVTKDLEIFIVPHLLWHGTLKWKGCLSCHTWIDTGGDFIVSHLPWHWEGSLMCTPAVTQGWISLCHPCCDTEEIFIVLDLLWYMEIPLWCQTCCDTRRDLYRDTPAVKEELDACCLIRRIAQFSHFLRHIWVSKGISPPRIAHDRSAAYSRWCSLMSGYWCYGILEGNMKAVPIWNLK